MFTPRFFSSSVKKYAGQYTVTLIPGDGIGAEMAGSVKTIFKAAQVPVYFEEFAVSGLKPDQTVLNQSLESLRRNKVGLKGILYTPLVEGHKSFNVAMRKDLDIFASKAHLKNVVGVNSRHSGIDLFIIRENTEGEYSGLEHQPYPGVIESLKVVSLEKTDRIIRYAFDFALKNGRKKITCVHKANIMKLSDGLFLSRFYTIAEEYKSSGLICNDMIVDNAAMQLVSKPQQFDVVVTGNLYGNIMSNVAAGLIGGPGLVAGANFGSDCAVFEPGCRHVAMDIQGRNKANPSALILSAVLMLKHLHLDGYASRISDSLYKTISSGKCLTPDMGGDHTTTDFTLGVISNFN